MHSRPFINLLRLDPSLAKKGWGEDFNASVPYTLQAVYRDNPAVSIEMLRALTRLEANVNISGPSPRCATALFSAASLDTHINIVKFLIKQKGIIYSQSITWHIKKKKEEKLLKIFNNIDKALEEMQAINMFRAGKLHSSRSESHLSNLPQYVRNLIADYVESEYS